MLFSLTTYQVIWWILIGFVLILYAWTSGFDLGIGVLLPFIARDNNERRVLINVIGPTWDGNQVWLIFGGGIIFAIYPPVYAMLFSGFYIAMLLVLWTLFLRPVGFEYRAKIHHVTWQTAWDWALFIGSAVPAIVMGVALGNLLLGVPMHFNSDYRGIYEGNFWQLLNPFSLLIGVISLVMLVTHGANLLALRTSEIIQQRCFVASRIFSSLFIFSFATAGLLVAFKLTGYQLIYSPREPQAQLFDTIVHQVPKGLLLNYYHYPWTLAAPIVALAGAIINLVMAFKNKAGIAFMGSLLMVAGAILTFGFSMFPFIVPSITHPNQSLTVWNATTGKSSLVGLFWVAIIMLPLIIFYTQWVYRKMWRTITPENIKQQQHELY